MFLNTYYSSFNLTTLPYYMGFGEPWVYMSEYWHLGQFPQFSCALWVEVLNMVFLWFEPEPLLIKGLKALGYIHAKAPIPSPLRTGDTIFWSDHFWND